VAGFLGAHDADKSKFLIPLYFLPNNISQLHGQVKGPTPLAHPQFFERLARIECRHSLLEFLVLQMPVFSVRR
jgi:hypothetical protein